MADDRSETQARQSDPDTGDGQRGGVRQSLKLSVVAVVCAVVGFAAVYFAIAPGRDGPTGAQPLSAQAGGTTARAAEPAGAKVTPAALPKGPGRNPLSVGEMAMFVFKPQPMEIADIRFKDPQGKEISLDAFKGRVILVNLWATWCAPCREEMPDLNALQAKLGGDDFEVVAISLDRGSDAKPRAFLKKIGIDQLAFYHDPTSRLGTKLKTIGMPATVLIDRKGRELGRLVGPAKWASDDAVRLIRAAIANAG